MEHHPSRDHFIPVDPGGGIEILDDPYFEDDYRDSAVYEERRPQAQHRMSALSIHDDQEFEEVRPRKERVKAMVDRKVSPDYLYYRLTKNGDDWSRAFKDEISAPIEQIEKKAREKRGSDGTVLEQMSRMSHMRRGQIENILERANDMETGSARWEVAYIKAKKLLSGKKTKAVVVPEMEIILARTKKPIKPRQKSNTAEFVDLRETYEIRPKKEKRYTQDNYSHGRKDSGLAMLSDPITNLPLFDRDGRPIDENGPVQFTGLPPQIPRDKPLGAKLDEPKEKDKNKDKDDKKGGKRDKSQKRSKSREKFHDHENGHDPDVVVVPEGEFDGDAPPIEGMFGEVKDDKRGRRGKSPHGHHDQHDDHYQHPEVVGDPRRSHSRRRQGGHEGEYREKSTHRREKSRHRGDSVHFPNRHTQQYFDGSSVSSGGSDASHYGYEYDATSSNTSIGTHGIPRRGSLVRREARPDVVYKEHRRGPSGPVRHSSYSSEPPRYYSDPPIPRYHEEAHYVKPGRTPRDTFVVYPRPAEGRHERPIFVRQSTMPIRIPEDRQLIYDAPVPYQSARDLVPVQHHYNEQPPLARRNSELPPVLLYPNEDRDVHHPNVLEHQSGNIESYQRERIREEYLSNKEREMDERERELSIREEVARRMRRDSRDDDRDFNVRDKRRASRIAVDRYGQEYFID
ncbi:hypothetical protein LTR84_010425 [Exophiala bonariae]|uniref:Apoptosis regulator Bcl-2 family BH4 domain-containing protein n=1 Tax=Exophiala bonariae TaxID=1690606 RepID=A0AAV9MT09_9EURO|nr:hypothetical protein LTR84_010425 [Exophiala bonariae]